MKKDLHINSFSGSFFDDDTPDYRDSVGFQSSYGQLSRGNRYTFDRQNRRSDDFSDISGSLTFDDEVFDSEWEPAPVKSEPKEPAPVEQNDIQETPEEPKPITQEAQPEIIEEEPVPEPEIFVEEPQTENMVQIEEITAEIEPDVEIKEAEPQPEPEEINLPEPEFELELELEPELEFEPEPEFEPKPELELSEPEQINFDEILSQGTAEPVPEKVIHIQSEIVANHARECFCLMKYKGQDISVKSSGNCEEISKGLFDIVSVGKVIDYDGTEKTYLSVRYWRDRNSLEGQIELDSLIENPKSLYDIADRNRVSFKNRRYAALVAEHVISVAREYKDVPLTYKGFYRDTAGNIRHPQEADIFRNSVSIQEMREFLTNGNSEGTEIRWRTLFILCYRLLTEIRTAGIDEKYPALCFIAGDVSASAVEIAGVVGDTEVYRIDKSIISARDKSITVIDLCAGTEYYLKKYLNELVEDSVIHPVLFVADDIRYFGNSVNEEKIVFLPYETEDLIGVETERIYDFIRSALLRKNISSDKWKDIADNIDVSGFPESAGKLMSNILLSVWLILTETADKSSAERYIGIFRKETGIAIANPGSGVRNKLIKLLRSGADGVSLNRSGNVFITVDAFNKAFHDYKNAAPKLESEGLIIRGELSLQRTATINGQSKRVYEVVQNKLFSYGELKASVNNFGQNRPEKMLPIADCSGERVFLVPEESTNLMIVNHNSDQASTFISGLIRSVRENGSNVIVPALQNDISFSDDAVSCYLKDSGLYYSENSEALDIRAVSEKLINIVFTSDKERIRGLKDILPLCPENSLLLIDEALGDTLGSRRAELKKLIRTAERCGVIICTLQKQLSSDDHQNISALAGLFSTFMLFGCTELSTTERRIFGIPSGESPEKHAVDEMISGQFLAVGSLATEKGYIRYPVILNMQSNDTE